jgi:AAHS family 4-hydroxybenzoate transporter-like MFS transporter
MPNIVALVAEFMPTVRRGRLLTWLFIAHGLGASIAGLIGPTLVAYHSWQAAFWAGGGLLLAFVPFLYLYLPEILPFPDRARSLRSAYRSHLAADRQRSNTRPAPASLRRRPARPASRWPGCSATAR